jgi:hypothetical protein
MRREQDHAVPGGKIQFGVGNSIPDSSRESAATAFVAGLLRPFIWERN